MATEAPEVVARCVSSSLCTPPHQGSKSDLQTLFILEDANALWKQLHAFVQSQALSTGDYETLTQDLFLHLLAAPPGEYFTCEEVLQDFLAYRQHH
ncbi:MAG: hypothetical protein HY231_14300 [Acidobacteria bacterium]|nr:hypothetical protein [Acidobacteriota bacterium]